MKPIWRVGIVAVVLLALGGIAAGIVAAQTGGTSTPTEQSATATEQGATSTEASDATATPDAGSTPTGKKQQLIDDFLTRLAANLGITVDQLKQALTTTENQLIDQAVVDGRITQDEADRIKERIANGDLLPFFHHGHRPDFAHGFKFGFHLGVGLPGDLIKSTADFLGVTRQDVIDALQNHQSLAQIAEAHGKTADDLANYLLDQLKSNLDQAVKDNRITQRQEDNILSGAKDRITNAINSVGFPGRGDRDLDSGTSHNGASDSIPAGTANPSSL